MRLTFVDNLIYNGSPSAPSYDLQPHLGLLSLVAVARGAGHEAEVYDPKYDLVRGELRLDATLYERMAARILARDPDIVGFTALGCNFHCVVNVAAHLKRLRPALPILLGGPHATILHREILSRFAAFDVVVRNEAEATLLPLLARLGDMELENLPGVSYRSPHGDLVCTAGAPLIENLDELPVPAYDCYPLAALGLNTIRVEAGRGCPFACTFCSTASFFGRTYRLKSVPRLLAEMDGLHRAYGYTDFKLNHDLFTVNRKKVMAFCEALYEREYTWGCSARVDCVDEELLAAMWRAGCRNVYFGIEAGSARMQRISQKRLDLALVDPMLDESTRLGMKTTASFITGYPEEELDDQAATLDFAARLACRRGTLTDSQIHLLTPEPGTQLMARYGDGLRYDGHVSDFNFPHLDPRDDELIARDPAIFANHHYFPSVLPRERHVFVSSAWVALFDLGRPVLGYALRWFDGRLSVFLDEAFAWHARTAPRSWNVDLALLSAFVSARFGERHHLASLFRYAVATTEASRSAAQPPAEAFAVDRDPQETPLVLVSGAVVLRGVHECVGLLERIASDAADAAFDDASAGARGDLLLVPRPAEPGRRDRGTVVTYQIDAATADLLERFRQPKSYWACCAEIADEPAGRFPDWHDLQGLRELGVLRTAALDRTQALTLR